jgi:hypothetical protein
MTSARIGLAGVPKDDDPSYQLGPDLPAPEGAKSVRGDRGLIAVFARQTCTLQGGGIARRFHPWFWIYLRMVFLLAFPIEQVK